MSSSETDVNIESDTETVLDSRVPFKCQYIFSLKVGFILFYFFEGWL